jgi:hypothetical protein
MPTVNEVLGGMLQNFLQHPRTTISGVLTFLLTGIPVLLGTGAIHGKAAAVLFSLCGGCKLIWAAFFMKDSGSQLAQVPGSLIPQMVPSHEVPDNPAAIPVQPK